MTIHNDSDTIRMALLAIKAKDRNLYNHAWETEKVSTRIAHILRPPDLSISEIRALALVHDIGMINVPDSILKKQEPLAEREWENIYYHPHWGAEFLRGMHGKLSSFAEFILQHHERPDGSGYPRKLQLDDIHPIARILNISDRFAAMVKDRPFRKAVSAEYAVEKIIDDVRLFFPNDYRAILEVLSGHSTILQQIPKINTPKVWNIEETFVMDEPFSRISAA